MSVVSGITLHISCAENFYEGDPNDIYDLIEVLNKWLLDRGFQPLKEVIEAYGGTKHPHVCVFGAGYNFFCEDEFILFFESIEWLCPESVILIVNPEDG